MRARFPFIWSAGLAVLLGVASAASGTAQEKILAEAYNGTGLALYRQLAIDSGNVVYSPYAIGTALAMVLSGARTVTETEMRDVLKHKLSRVELDAANARLMAILSGYDQSALPPACPRGLKLVGQRCTGPREGDKCLPPSVRDDMGCVAVPRPLPWAKILAANALAMPRLTDAVSFEYVENLKSQYAAEIFRGVPASTINRWMGQRTEGKIETMVDRIDPVSPLTVLSGMSFKADWIAPFPKKETKEGGFNLSRGRQIRVPTMQQRGSFASVSRTGYRAIRLPYAVRSLALIVVVPNDVEAVAQVAARLDARELAELRAALGKVKPNTIRFTLPRFKVAFSADLTPALQQIGFSSPFSSEQADFSGMTGAPLPKGNRLRIGQFRHVAVLDVDENGTEPAASGSINYEDLTVFRGETFAVDRPFLVFLVDDNTGAILFQGRISDPR